MRPHDTQPAAAAAAPNTHDTHDWDPRLRDLLGYWRGIHRPDGRLPRRAEFDPIDVPRLLPWIWLMDVARPPAAVAPLRFRYRLMGTAHVEAMGRDVTGLWLDEAFPDFPATDGYRDYVEVAERQRPSYRIGPAQYHVPEYRTIERLMLPLAGDDGRTEMLLALTVYHQRRRPGELDAPDAE